MTGEWVKESEVQLQPDVNGVITHGGESVAYDAKDGALIPRERWTFEVRGGGVWAIRWKWEE